MADNMADKGAADREEPPRPPVDDLSRLQAKLDDLGKMFYTYLGILQRDAPPAGRPPDEAEELANDRKMRDELRAKTPAFASDIVSASKQVDLLISHIDKNLLHTAGHDAGAKERQLLDAANVQSVQAGDDMQAAVDEATKLLGSMRDIISARDAEP